MGSNERRMILRDTILSGKTPLSSEALLEKLGVSRQILLQDIAVLRAQGVPFTATPFGYMPEEVRPEPRHTALFACRHTTLELSRTELLIIVQCGGIVRSVLIDHPLYGEMRVSMMVRTSEDAEKFIEQSGRRDIEMLCSVADGIHLHLVEAESRDKLDFIKNSLRLFEILIE